MKRYSPIPLILLLGLTAAFLSVGGEPRRWIQGGREDFLKGNPESAAITSDGGIVLPSKTTKLFDSRQQFVWDLAVGPSGKLYVAGGNEGIIYDDKGNPVHDDEKPEIHALAIGPDGLLYFATSPSGAVYRMAPGAPAQEFFAPKEDGNPERYIWDLAFDRGGNLYVATGLEGRLYKVAPDGTGRVAFDSDESHITCLAVDSESDRLIFGTDPHGQILQLDAGGKVFALHDSTFTEINNVAVAPGGSIFATGVSSDALKKEQKEEEKEGSKSSGGEETKVSETASLVVAGASDDSEKDGQISALFRILGDGTVETLWTSDKLVTYSLAVDRGGRAVFGTGPEGRLIAIDGDGTETVLRRLEGKQVTALLGNRGQLYAGVSNLGMVYQITSQYAERGVFISQVLDTGTVSSFGAIRWSADEPQGAVVRIGSRSGNTAKPDNTWSDWSVAYSDRENSKISSPAARYIQWKAELSTTEPSASPVLKSVSLHYLQRNLRPRVSKAVILPAGIAVKPSMPLDPLTADTPAEIAAELEGYGLSVQSPSGMGQLYYQRQMRTLRWEAKDTNGDKLRYALLLRPIESTSWSPLAQDLEDNFYSFDTTSLPDGMYVARIAADDSLSNPAESAESAHLDTKPFAVDNTPPRIEGLAATAPGRDATVSFRVSDDFSPVKSVRLRVDDGDWIVVYPEDGITDSRVEQVQAAVRDLTPGEHTIQVLALDELYNAGSGRAVVTIR